MQILSDTVIKNSIFARNSEDYHSNNIKASDWLSVVKPMMVRRRNDELHQLSVKNIGVCVSESCV